MNKPCGDIPRVMLLSGTAPGTGNVGEIYLRDLCKRYPQGEICCFALIPGTMAVSPAAELDGLPIMIRKGRREHVYASLAAKTGRLIALLASEYLLRKHVRNMADEAVAFARKHDVGMIWAVLDSPIMIYLAQAVHSRLGLPMVSHVWDVPEHFSETFAVLPWQQKRLMASFAHVLRNSLRCGVISEAMAEEYRAEYGIDPVVIRYGVHPLATLQGSIREHAQEHFVIGFAGNLYASDAWDALLHGLQGINWHIDGRSVVIRVFGPHLLLNTHAPVHVEYMGWRTSEQTVEMLADVDICYLPYWFEPARRQEVRLAFPGKMSTYLGAGKPVLFHGPEYASVTAFMARFPAGVCCHSLDAAAIVDCLKQLACDEQFYRQAVDAAAEAVQEELSTEVFLTRFATMIGIEASHLIADADMVSMTSGESKSL
ncbi:hypothetical protein [Mariprofundus ferrooxydans]|uniref:Uncharacterized protein n=1 Tax=Mariprofundus ferrooxydans PV-1 TaxID=314345 RepID=Q0EZA2_9PROT|nr:hypothetical protein [Mariprofundus ferrooxydans]EAU54522.1 hypothetical protein SPV1_07501 [Mariprofundus ferrooxydans PV-1]KON48856.1 hypothetical protein AL013_00490 [Mariprofundus ferrooxydans]